MKEICIVLFITIIVNSNIINMALAKCRKFGPTEMSKADWIKRIYLAECTCYGMCNDYYKQDKKKNPKFIDETYAATQRIECFNECDNADYLGQTIKFAVKNLLKNEQFKGVVPNEVPWNWYSNCESNNYYGTRVKKKIKEIVDNLCPN